MTAIVRRDGSSKFGANKRWGTFPSVSVGWLISEEDFIPKNTALNSLKLRAGWGQVGNDNIANYLSTVVVASGFNYPFGNTNNVISSGFALSGIPNPDIQWETVTQYSIGVDADFFDNRLNLVAEYYNKTHNDMLVPVPQSGVTGLSNGLNAGEIVLNTGDLTNSGLEFSANYAGEMGKLSYTVGGNITTLSNKIKSIPAPINRYELKGSFLTRTAEGRSLGEFYGFVADGIFQNQGEVDAHATQNSATAPGDIRFKDINNDGVIDDDDKTFIGNPIPDFTYGFSIGLNYENFDFSLQGNGVQGNEIYNVSKVSLIDNSQSLNKLNFTPWSSSNTNSTYPRAIDSDPNKNLRNSSYFVEDGSFLRIKTIQLGYSVSQKYLSKLGMSKFRLYGGVQNPFTFTKYSGLDPEVGNAGGSNLVSGIDNFVYPMARVFSIGLNAQF
jgi:TonB-linked SusC/RagA family outer membrane protein